MDKHIREAVAEAHGSTAETAPARLVTIGKTLAREVERLGRAVAEQRGVIVGLHDDGAEIADRLDERWPV